ncbi:MAG: 16S rRNA (cytosine(1402)-N(4))-methyltransferase RsmH [Rhodovibrionaceae bacterium]|nr:16S rRNA (cytosine(1402)-N(4))-methyltransferase RsmH [Rhodovibrionaceae bacterium]
MNAPGQNGRAQNEGRGAGHVSVLLDEVLTVLAPADGETHVDGTFGAGGYAVGLLEAADCRVWGIDRDSAAVAAGRKIAARYPGRLTVIEGRFGDMDALLEDQGVARVDGVTLDLGVSSMQLDEAGRGFSFRFDGPLDMRMGSDGPSAADLVNGLPESELADLIFRYGEEKKARRVARAIADARREAPITRTLQLAEIVRGAVGRGAKGDGIDPATRTFQALRIAVNDEIGELERGLVAAERLLAPGGRLAVVSFHSLEDRTVKTFLRARSGEAPRGSRHMPEPEGGPAPTFEILSRGGVKPRTEETASNPRARSARLRAARRTPAPSWTPQRSGGFV